MDKIKWQIDGSSKTPIYLQIHNAIKDSITDGELQRGTKLSQRKVAEIFQVSRMPVAEAFSMLEAEGFIVTKPQSGTVVSNNVWALLQSGTPSFWQNYIQSGRQKDMPSGLLNIFKKLETPNKVLGDWIASDFEPEKPLIKAVEGAIKRLKNTNDLGQVRFSGMDCLKSTLVSHLQRYGIAAKPENILVTQGIGESLITIAMGLLNNGASLIYETPSFVNTIMLFQSTGVNMEEVPMDSEGIIIEKLLAKINRIKKAILYTQQVNHNPTGTHTSKDRRNAILAASNSLHFPIIENDMFRDFVFDTKYPRPLKAFDNNEQVIYVGSLWSGFMGFKTSWIVASEFIIERLKYVSINIELVPNNMVQIIVDEMLSQGHYYDYMEKLSPMITKQYYEIKRLFDKYLGALVSWRTNSPSFFIWIEFNKSINVVKLHQAAQDMLFFQGNMFDWSDIHHARINTLGVEPKTLEQWMKKIYEIVK